MGNFLEMRNKMCFLTPREDRFLNLDSTEIKSQTGYHRLQLDDISKQLDLFI